MAQVAILGLSNFGYYLALRLSELGSEVMVVDNDRNRIDQIKPYVSRAVIADATDKRTLEKLGLENIDAVVISLGEKLEASILSAFYLKEMKVKRIIAKALSEDHARILEKIGVDRVVFPERDSGYKEAPLIHRAGIVQYVQLEKGLSILEMKPLEEMVGKTIRQLDFRKKYRCQILAIRANDEYQLPDPDQKIEKEHILTLLGREEDLAILQKKPK